MKERKSKKVVTKESQRTGQVDKPLKVDLTFEQAIKKIVKGKSKDVQK